MIHATRPQINPNKVRLLEEAISNGQYDKIRPYAADAVNYYSTNKSELHRRRMFLAQSGKGHSDGIHCFAILSALCDDIKGWEVVVDFLGEDIDPSLGFLIYRFILHYNGKPEMLQKWNFLLEFSKRMGHLESTRIIWEQSLAKLGPLRFPLMAIMRIWLAFRGVIIAVKSPDDPRLPKRGGHGRPQV